MTTPRFIPPMLATLVSAPFDDPDWLFEVKWDGFRVEAVVDGDSVSLLTRGGQDASSRYFGNFLEPPTWLGARQAIVDGEVIALDDHGEPDFALLQARIKGRGMAAEPTPFVYEVFDLLKIRPEQELVVGGWVTGAGKAVELGALLVGVYEDGELRYAGKVGAGFTNTNRAELLAALAPLATTETPFETPPPRAAARNAQWLRPELVIRAEFAGWTTDGFVRQAAYKGLELEKDPRSVIRERPKA
jgi:ATP-dependent DNA ligase